VASALIAGAALTIAGGCGRAEESSAAKRSPRPPAPPRVDIPRDLHIDVTVDGAPGQAVDAALLGQLAPDFADSERRAWRLRRLLPALAMTSATVEAVSKAGVTVRYAATGEGGLEPALLLTRRGELVVAAVDPLHPFPDYHGQGGRLGRPGDPMPHVGRIVLLRVVTH
jgi:hypothetical protein